MENIKTILEVAEEKICQVVQIESGLPNSIINRLKTLGIFENARIKLIKKSNFSKTGIVLVLGTKICLDYKILSKIIVRPL